VRSGTLGEPSEILLFDVLDVVNPTPDTIVFDHATYVQGLSDTMFLEPTGQDLYWTEVIPNPYDPLATGVLYDYSLSASPQQRLRNATTTFYHTTARWGAHGFSAVAAVNAMMIVVKESDGYTVSAVYLNSDLTQLALVDTLRVPGADYPVLGQGIAYASSQVDFAIMMAGHNAGSAELVLFVHCTSSYLCYALENDSSDV